MALITAWFNKIKTFFVDMKSDILVIYDEKGIAPFKKPLLFAAPTLLILYAGVYVPLGSKVTYKTLELEKIQVIAANYSEYSSAMSKLSGFQRRLPLIKDKDEWLNYIITSTAKPHDIIVDSLSAQTETEVGNFLVVSRVVTVTTTYDKMGRWVADIEKSPILLKVADLNVKRDADRIGVVKVTMTLSTLFPKGSLTGEGA